MELGDVVAVMGLVVTDCENDVAQIDGQPFNGLTTGTTFGNVYAEIAAVATAVELIARELETQREGRQGG